MKTGVIVAATVSAIVGVMVLGPALYSSAQEGLFGTTVQSVRPVGIARGQERSEDAGMDAQRALEEGVGPRRLFNRGHRYRGRPGTTNDNRGGRYDWRDYEEEEEEYLERRYEDEDDSSDSDDSDHSDSDSDEDSSDSGGDWWERYWQRWREWMNRGNDSESSDETSETSEDGTATGTDSGATTGTDTNVDTRNGGTNGGQFDPEMVPNEEPDKGEDDEHNGPRGRFVAFLFLVVLGVVVTVCICRRVCCRGEKEVISPGATRGVRHYAPVHHYTPPTAGVPMAVVPTNAAGMVMPPTPTKDGAAFAGTAYAVPAPAAPVAPRPIAAAHVAAPRFQAMAMPGTGLVIGTPMPANHPVFHAAIPMAVPHAAPAVQPKV